MAAVVAAEFNLVPLPVDFLKSSEARVNFRPFQAPKNWSRWGGCATKENDTREKNEKDIKSFSFQVLLVVAGLYRTCSVNSKLM